MFGEESGLVAAPSPSPVSEPKGVWGSPPSLGICCGSSWLGDGALVYSTAGLARLLVSSPTLGREQYKWSWLLLRPSQNLG